MLPRHLGEAVHGAGDFATCVNAYGPAPLVIAAIRSAQVDAYPDPSCILPRAAAAMWWRRPPDEIACGAGTAELIHAFALAHLRPRDRVLIPRPAFAEYGRAALIAGAEIRRPQRLPIDAPGWRVAEGFLDALRTTVPRVAFLASPTSPAGTAIPLDAVRAIADICAAQDTILLLDQAYDAFTRTPLGTPALPGHPSVLHLRSLTKDHALAGIRVGFAIGTPDTITAINRVRVPWSVSSVAQAAATAALTPESTAHVAQSIARLRTSAQSFASWCDDHAIPRIASDTHYLLLRASPRSIAVRDCTSFGLPGWIRIAARTEPEMSTLRSALMVH